MDNGIACESVNEISGDCETGEAVCDLRGVPGLCTLEFVKIESSGSGMQNRIRL